MLEKLNRTNLLYDIYSSLLTERQQEVLRLYYSDNLTLAEIAAEYGVSRQAIHDLIRRALTSLESFEEKLGLYVHYCIQDILLREARSILQGPVGPGEKRRLQEIVEQLQHDNEQ